MANKGYATVADVAAFMGATFSVAQQTIAGLAITAAEKWLDETIRHAWLETGPITEDVLVARSNILRVSKPPIKTLTSVSGIGWPGATPFVIDNTCHIYTIHSLRDGEVRVAGAQGLYAVQFVYEPNDDDVPDEVRLATMTLAAASLRMAPTLNDAVDPTLVQSYVVGGELEVVFRKNILTSGAAAQQALGYLDSWTKGYVVI